MSTTILLSLIHSLFISSFPSIPLQGQSANTPFNQADSAIFQAYEYAIKRELFDEEDALSREALDREFDDSRMMFMDHQLVHSPDGLFKIYAIQLESCGAYCNSSWYAWIHYNLKAEQEESQSINLNQVKEIHPLPDGKYLIIDESWGRPASVFTVQCLNATLISIKTDSVMLHPIPFRKGEQLAFCQDDGLEAEEASLKYNPDSNTLSYRYISSYAYSHGLNTDSICSGEFDYLKGEFRLKKENIIRWEQP